MGREERNGDGLHAPLLNDQGLAGEEYTVTLGDQDEQWEVNYDTPVLEAASRNTFQQIHEQNKNASSDVREGKRDLAVSRSNRRRGHTVRNPIEKKSLVARAAYSAKTDTLNFLYNVMIGLVLWPKWSWDAMKGNISLTVLSAKQGVCAGLASVLCVIKFPEPYTQLSYIAIWAVITTDLLYEANIGLSISKGFNRVLGTLAAGFLGFALNQLGPELGPVYPYFVVFCVTMGGFVFRFLKGIPPLKDQWGYAFTVATMAFHIFIISPYLDVEKWTLPMLRFSMILLGFAMSSLVNIAIQPIYAGDALHKLVAKNFETAATVFQRCVEEYINDTKLDHVPDILSGRSVDDKIHQSYHEIVMSDSDIDKLLSAVLWEPSHGKFFKNYPWDLYDDITDYLRYTLYDVIALDLCLRANIQAPKDLREIFAPEMLTIANECGTILRKLGDSIKNMKKFPSADIMKNAEEAAVSLQFKIYLNTNVLLGNTNPDLPSSPMFPPASANQDWQASSYIPEDYFRKPARAVSEPINIASSPEQKSFASPPQGWLPSSASPQNSYTRVRSGPVPRLETLTEGVPAINIKIPKTSSNANADAEQQQQQGEKTPSSAKGKRSFKWQQTFSHRKGSLGPHWDGTLERISALSLVKFASLLIEVVTKMRYVVDCVEDLGEQARFEECS